MKTLRHIALSAALCAAALCAQARPSILTLADAAADSTVVFPESVETDVNRMMQNWYLQNYTALDKEVDNRPDVATTDAELIERLQAIPTTIEMPFNSVVRQYIDMYTGRKRSLVESMLGMSLYYMPIFEQAIEKEGIPIELKYLPVIESAMNPDAVSRAGAVGLWQIMLPTARGLGLEINTLVDERRDPVRSSEAAARYLRELYDIYKDWSLAIAAYNCGPGNVNKALRRAGDDARKDFWAIYPYLPRETRGYVPCFIAATYVMNYYNKHNISPALAKKPIVTDSVHVSRRVHFQQIADILKLPVEQLQVLNPQYRKQEIPGTPERPWPLVLPANQTYAYIMSEDAIAAHNADLYARRDVVEPATGMEARPATVDGQEGEWVVTEDVKWHKVRRNETMASIAKRYGVSLKSLKRWNGNIRKPRRGQSVKIVSTKRVFKPYEKQPTDSTTIQQNVEPTDNLLVRNPETSQTPTEQLTATVDEATALDPIDNGSEAVADAGMDAATTAETSAGAASDASGKVGGAFSASHAKQEAARQAEAERLAAEQAAADKAAQKKAAADKARKKKQQQHKTVTVRKGDSLARIAKKNGTTVAALQKLNPSVKAGKIQPGDKIRVK
ncbi:MAG: transglycosylase SLT domain-containing protein [bacterium]|nr:transglycosylase SLT domain-containing protein [bacterium]